MWHLLTPILSLKLLKYKINGSLVFSEKNLDFRVTDLEFQFEIFKRRL